MEQLRQQVLGMMKTNKSLPDIEKLERFEFIMDTDERNAMLAEREKLLKEVSLFSRTKENLRRRRSFDLSYLRYGAAVRRRVYFAM